MNPPAKRPVSRPRSWARPALLVLLFTAPGPAAFGQTPPGQPRTAGVEVEQQGEKDWVDGRWNKTETGQFMASNLEIPGSKAAKPLSIKIGENDEGAVCFDTLDCSLRAGWTGGFLTFDPARFGLLRAPKIAGKLAFVVPPGPAWDPGTIRYAGLHLHGRRVVLEYSLGGARVLESPWLETNGGAAVFTRTFAMDPATRESKLMIVAAGNEPDIKTESDRSLALAVSDGKRFGVEAIGPQIHLARADGKLYAVFPPGASRRLCKLAVWVAESPLTARLEETAKAVSDPQDLSPLLEPGQARWLPELVTTGRRGADSDFLAVDTLAVPYDNPWKALMFLSGVDFTPDGAAYVCGIHGDVWRVTGIDAGLRALRWKRFATGLFQPLGLKVRDGQVYVLGRDQITRLRDLDGDGEADFYENFCNLIHTSPGGHEYATSLEKDDAGRFYFTDPFGVHRVEADGRAMKTLATGFRNPNGLGVSGDGRILTVSPQQGEWTPSSVICEVKPGGYYGYGGPKVTKDRPLGYDPPLCWIPHNIDNSSSSQVWVPENHWGSLGGKMLHLRWGSCGMMLALRDVAGGVPQGAVTLLPGRFLSGPHRGSFNPRDGDLYVAGSAGWQTSAVKDGCLQRVRFTREPVLLPVAWHAMTDGLSLSFSKKLDRLTAEDTGSYSVKQWNYRYAAQYGSKDWSVTNPEKEGRDEVAVKSARLLPDGQTVFLEIGGLRPVMQMQISYNLSNADGQASRNQLWLTLNALDRDPGL
jgi:hypothetical protein